MCQGNGRYASYTSSPEQARDLPCWCYRITPPSPCLVAFCDTCHSFFLPSSATGGGRKRPLKGKAYHRRLVCTHPMPPSGREVPSLLGGGSLRNFPLFAYSLPTHAPSVCLRHPPPSRREAPTAALFAIPHGYAFISPTKNKAELGAPQQTGDGVFVIRRGRLRGATPLRKVFLGEIFPTPGVVPFNNRRFSVEFHRQPHVIRNGRILARVITRVEIGRFQIGVKHAMEYVAHVG